MSTTDRHDALRLKGERRKADILRVSRRIFLEKGYEASSVQDILDALQCSKGGFYHHFDSKLAVLAGIAGMQAAESHAEYLKAAGGNPLEDLSALLRRSAYLRVEDTALLRALRELTGRGEGGMLRDALIRASAAAFYGDFTALSYALAADGQAGFPGEGALRLAFEAHLHGAFLMLREADVTQALPLLQALRRQAEAALRLVPGTVEILSGDALAALGRALSQT